MLVVTWNLKGNNGFGERRLDRIVEAVGAVGADVLLLQEVAAGEAAGDLKRGLATKGFSGWVFGCDDPLLRPGKNYGSAIASRWPLAGDTTGWAVDAPWPQLLARATISAPHGEVDAISAHVPNGSRNGWRKIDTFEVLAKGLGGPSKDPRIVAGDFNEPERLLASGELVPFNSIEGRSGEPTWEGEFRDVFSEPRPRARWRDGVQSVLGRNAPHGLRHAWLSRHGFEPVTTHVVQGQNRFFDHMLVSEHFEIEDVGYYSAWRAPGLSDHAAGWVRVKLR